MYVMQNKIKTLVIKLSIQMQRKNVHCQLDFTFLIERIKFHSVISAFLKANNLLVIQFGYSIPGIARLQNIFI